MFKPFLTSGCSVLSSLSLIERERRAKGSALLYRPCFSYNKARLLRLVAVDVCSAPNAFPLIAMAR